MAKEKRLITAALPYVNSYPHAGNIVGSHLPADIFARYCRLAGYETVFIGGSDEHGTATEIAAEKEGLTPKQLCDKYYAEHKKIYDWFQISYDNFSRTSRPIHHKLTQEVFLKAYKNGYITEDTLTLPYCNHCKRTLADRFIEGTCPKCNYDKARGDQCEKCGNILEPKELKNQHCAICKNGNIEFRQEKHLFFSIDKLSKKLQAWIEKNKTWRPHVKNTALAWIREGLKPRCITRNLSWGVKVPLKGYEHLVFYCWYEAPYGYVSSTLEWNENKGKEYWTDGKTKIYNFLGKDNIVFHTLFFPSFLLATGGYNLPYNVIGLQYLNYEDGKISKSQGHGRSIFGDVIPDYGIPVDFWRFYLTYLIPETKDTDFSWKEFEQRITGDLIGNFGNFINRTLTFVHAHFKGELTRPKALDQIFITRIQKQVAAILNTFENIELREALAEILRLSSYGNEYFDKKQPWKTKDPETLWHSVALCEILGILIQPFLPDTSKKILHFLGSKRNTFDALGDAFTTKGYAIKKPELLFDKNEFQEKIKNITQQHSTTLIKNKEVEGIMTNISLAEFQKVELTTGKISEVQDHPKADKLYVLKVDIGKKEIQLVAGLKQHYTKKELEGKTIIVVKNLEPAELRGVKSEGMLLAAEKDGKVVLLGTEKDIGTGAKIQ